jgi:hypothetical protein
MTKRTVAFLAAAALVAVGAALPALGQSRSVAQSVGGRYQVVNGTPDMARNIMLLDTATGNTWILCGDPQGVSQWCQMDRSRSPGVEPRKAPGNGPNW